MDDYFLIAKVVALYGNDGSVKIVSYSDFPERFFSFQKVFMDFFGKIKEISVESVKRDGSSFVIKFKKFTTRDASLGLIGKEIFVAKEDLVQLPEHTYFIHDLIGSKVIRDGIQLGIIVDVMSLPANDVYVINSEKGEEILIPALRKLILSFDAVNKELWLQSGEELFDNDYAD